MKKTLILMLIGILLLVGCGGNAVKGDVLFDGKVDEMLKIEFHMPDETIVVIEDEKQVEKICDALNEATYEKRTENDLVGGYIVRLMSDENAIELYYGVNYIGYEGTQYNIQSSNLKAIVSEIIDIE